MTIGIDLLPVGTVLSALFNQLTKTALAAQDIRSEKSFKRLGNYLSLIRNELFKLDLCTAGESSAVVRGLNSLKIEVEKAESLIVRYKESSLIGNILRCRSICEALQTAIRDIGNSLHVLELCTIDVNEDARNSLLLLEIEMTHAEVRVSDESLRVLEMLQTESEKERKDQARALELLEKIARSQGVLHEFRIPSELSKFKKDIEEAEERKEQQEVQYMQQVLSLLSQMDTASALDASSRRYVELKEEVTKFQDNLSPIEPSSQFKCHLTGKVMDDPVILSSGHTYQREAIQRWFDEDNITDPITGQPLQCHDLRPNNILSTAIERWRQQNYCLRILKARHNLVTGMEADHERSLIDLSELCKESTDCKNWIVFEGLVPVVLHVSKLRNRKLRALCFSTLELVVKDNDHAKEKLFEAGGIKQIIKNLDRVPSVTRTAISLLLEFVKNKNEVLIQLGQERGAILLLVTVLLRDDHADLRVHIEQMLDHLSDNQENIKAMVMANWCKPLVHRLRNGSEESKVAMTNALAHFDLDDGRREALIEQHAIKPLVDILKSAHIESKCAALKALRNLSSHDKAKKHFAEAGAVPLIVDSLKRYELALKYNAAAILADLTTNHGACFLVDAKGNSIQAMEIVQEIMGILIDFHSVSHSLIATDAVKVLLNLVLPSDADEIRKLISTDNRHIAPFLFLVRMAQPPLRDVAVQLLFSLCSKEMHAASFVSDDQECLKALLHLIKNNSVKISLQVAAVGIVSSIPLSDYGEDVYKIAEDVLPGVVKMVSGQDLEGQENALRFLLRFTESGNIERQRFLIELGLIDNLKQVLRSGTAVAKIQASVVLKNISRNTPRLSIEPQRRSFKLTRKPYVTCRVHRGRCSLKHTFCIVEAGVVPDIVETLKDRNAEVALAAMNTLETLLDENMLMRGVKILHEFKAIDQLFPLIHLDNDSCSEKCVELFEMILKVPGMKEIYGPRVQKSLTVLFASRAASVRQKALTLFREITST